MRIILRLMVFAQRYWGWLLLAFVCLLASTAFSLIVPSILRQAVDGILTGGDRGGLALAAAALIGASVLRGLFAFGNSYCGDMVSQRASYDIRNALYDRMQRLSFGYHDKTQTGQLMSRATEDVEAVRMMIGRGLLGMTQTVILFLGVSAVLILMDWRLAALTLAFLPAIGARAVIAARRLRRIWLRVQNLFGNLGTVLEENLTGMRVVKAFSHEEQESHKFAAEAALLYEEELKADRQMAFNVPLMIFLIGLPTALILWYGGREVAAGELTIGGLTQFIFYLGLMGMPVRRLGFVANLFSRATSSGQRILEVLDRESPVQEKAGAIQLNGVKGEVRFENVSFSYDSMGYVLKDVTFAARPGEVIAVVGASGSGKSTIANLVPRFYDVSEGQVTVDDIDVRDVTLASLRRNVGIVQQDVFLFSTTIRENIAYGAVNATMEEVIAAARVAHLHDFVRSLPHGYETVVGERGITLSGGEKQRLALARTLLMDPRILILDDSTSSVDAETELVIRQALSQFIAGRTTFIITHRLPVARSADLVLVMEDGRIVEHGKHRDLIARDGPYRHMYASWLAATGDGEALER